MRDVAALKAACTEMGLAVEENAIARGYGSNSHRGDIVIRLKGPYDIAVTEQQDGTYGLTCDWWDGHVEREVGANYGRLLQLYGVHKAQIEARKKGYTTRRQALTTQAGLMLVTQIMPLILGAIHRGTVKAVGCEDPEELAQDCVAIAAKQLDAAEAKGQPFTPGTIAYFAIRNLKQGRRSTGSSTVDALAPGTQLLGRATMRSMDEPVMLGDDPDDDVTLHDVLAAKGEDTACAAARRMDWDEVGLDPRERGILHGTVVGMQVRELAERYHVTPARIVQLRQGTGDRIQQAWGDTGLDDRTPAWKRMVRR